MSGVSAVRAERPRGGARDARASARARRPRVKDSKVTRGSRHAASFLQSLLGAYGVSCRARVTTTLRRTGGDSPPQPPAALGPPIPHPLGSGLGTNALQSSMFILQDASREGSLATVLRTHVVAGQAVASGRGPAGALVSWRSDAHIGVGLRLLLALLALAIAAGVHRDRRVAGSRDPAPARAKTRPADYAEAGLSRRRRRRRR